MIAWHAGPSLLASCFGMSFLSAIFPWINGEIVALSFAALMRSPAEMALLALLVAVGQTVGKCVLYYIGFTAGKLTAGDSARIERWRNRLNGRRRSALALVFSSSVTSIPPLYPTTLFAGSVRMAFGPFIGTVACGRVVRYCGLLLVPGVVLWLRG